MVARNGGKLYIEKKEVEKILALSGFLLKLKYSILCIKIYFYKNIYFYGILFSINTYRLLIILSSYYNDIVN